MVKTLTKKERESLIAEKAMKKAKENMAWILFTIIAAQASIAIDNARLYERSRTRQSWIEATRDIATELLAGDEPAPEGVHVVADGRDDAQTGDDDSALMCHAGSPASQIPRPPSTGRTTPVTNRAAGEAR